MSPRTAKWVAWSLWAVGTSALVTSVVFLWFGYGVARGVVAGFAPRLLLAIGLLLMLALWAILVTHQPSNRIGWILLIQVAIFSALQHLTMTYGFLALQEGWPGGETVSWISLTFAPGVFVLLGLAFLLFPNGHLPSLHWRPLPWIMGVAGVVATIGTIAAWNFNTYPTELIDRMGIIEPNNNSAANIAMGVIVACMLACAASLVVRLRSARGEARQQIKWVVFAAAVAALIHPILFAPTDLTPFVPAIQAPIIGFAFAIAIFRYRLYDIDIVISKTLVYGALAGFIGAVYVAIVVGVGELIGARANNVALAIAATVVVAVAFEPVRERVQRLANKVVYGERASPYEVMANFSHRMAGAVSIEDLLPRTAETAAAGVGADSSRVTLLLPDDTQRIELWPAGASLVAQVSHRFDVSHRDDVVGEIAVAKPAGEPLTPAEHRLLEDLASQAGLAFANARLTLELQDRIQELSAQTAALEASRARIVSAADTERRRLEKQIRTDVGQPLVELQRSMGEVRDLVIPNPAAAETELDELISTTNDTLDSLRELARGVFPPLLADQGLVAALKAFALKLGGSVSIEPAEGLDDARFNAEVEAALYFCTTEAIRSSVKEGDGEVTVTLSADINNVSFEVRPIDREIEQQGMADRVAALGGELRIESTAGERTAVIGVVPARQLQPV